MVNAADDVLLHYLSWFEDQKGGHDCFLLVLLVTLSLLYASGLFFTPFTFRNWIIFSIRGFFLYSTDWHAVWKRGRQSIIMWEASDVAVYGTASGTLPSVLGMTVCSPENLACRVEHTFFIFSFEDIFYFC